MPHATASSVTATSYQNIPVTKEDLDFADLVTLDLSDFDRPGGKERLAAQLKDAIHNVGFFYLVNFGLSPEEVDDQFRLGAKLFAIPEEEKIKYKTNAALPGGALGFNVKGSMPVRSGSWTDIELYDDPKYNAVFKDRPRPPPIAANAKQNEKFGRHLHNFVLYRLLVLTAIILQLEDLETLWRMHNYESISNCHLRYMQHHPRDPKDITPADEKSILEKSKGHTDFGTFTLLFRQPICALQVRNENDTAWKWVKPVKNSITVNVADTLSFLTGHYLKSSIHRVVLPPKDQRGINRYGVIYFSRPDDNVLLKPVDSPLIQKAVTPATPMTAGEWVVARHHGIDYSEKPKGTVINGIKVDGYS